jgi:effector-binding domain-containing protein
MLMLRQAEIKQKVADEEERLRRVTAWLSQIEQEDKMSEYDVVIKSVEPIRVASVRAVVPMPPDQGRLWGELETCLNQQKVKPAGVCFSLYHDDEWRERDWDIEVCEPVQGEVKPTGNVVVRELPAEPKLACTVHRGSFETIGKAYDAILKWICDNGYHITGPCREVYLSPAHDGSQSDPKTVSEIQYPVAK